MTKYFYIMILILVGLASCEDENPSDEAVLFDIVCLEKASNTGSIFSVAKPGSDEEIMLTASQQIDSRYVKPGDRLLLKYVPMSGIAYKSGAISIKGYGQIINGTLDTTEESVPDGWNQDPVYLLSAWRAGRFLNIHVQLPYDENPRFRLAASYFRAYPLGISYSDLISHFVFSERFLLRCGFESRRRTWCTARREKAQLGKKIR